MKNKLLELIDFEKVNILLEGFNKTTGFVTAILDLEGNVLSKSGWRQMCAEFHRINPKTSKRCTISDTVLAEKIAGGEKYNFYKCLNGLIDVALPIVINGEHIANLFSGQFLFDKPDLSYFKKQAEKFGFDEEKYLKALEKVPVVSKEKVQTAMEFLLNMTQIISEITFQKLELTELNRVVKESEEKFKNIFESANVGKSITLPTGETHVNNAFSKMLGYNREELLNKKWQEITPENEIAVIQKKLKPLINGKKDSARFEKRYIRKNGTLFWADVSVSVRRDENGKPLNFITTIIEITDRKMAEIMLRDEKEQKRIILESVGTPIFLKDNDHRIIFANRAFLDLFGLDEKSIIGKTLAENVPENERKHFREVDRNVLDTGIPDYREEEITLGQQTNTIITRKTRFIDGAGNKFLVGSIHNITDRKNAEEALKESEEKFRLAFLTSPDSININRLDDGMYVDINDSFTQITGYTREETIGKTSDEINIWNNPEDRSRLVVGLKEYGKYENLEAKFKLKNGRIIDGLMSATIISIAGVQHILSISKDISEFKQAEEAFKISAANLKSLIDNREDLIWSVDRNFNYIIFNNTYEKILNQQFNIELKKGMSSIKQMTEEQADFWIPKYISVFAGESITFEFSHEIKTGHRVFRTSLNPIIEGEAITGASVISIDITAHKQKEKALQESEERYRDLFENSHAVMLLINPENGNIVSANTAASTFYGWPNKELVSMNLSQINNLSKAELNSVLFQAAEKNKKHFIIAHILADQTIRNVEVYTTPIIIKGKKLLYSIIHDITERIEAEEKLKKLNQELEKRVDSRTIELTNSQDALLNIVEDLNEKTELLEQSAKLLEAKNKELETFTYSVSHDLKAPLRGIDGYSRLLQEIYSGELNDEAKQFIKTIRESTVQMNQLIEDLLAYSRLERTSIRISKLKIKHLIDSILTLLKNEITANKVNITLEVNDVEITADFNGLSIVLRNIVENAIKFSRHTQPPEIKIVLLENVHSWLISVADNGIGFDMKYHDRIFQIFQRLNLPESYKGTGIGLAMVYKSVERMGGKVWAESKPGSGAIFYIELPKI
jgi:PAS domain S-box-containing protein